MAAFFCHWTVLREEIRSRGFDVFEAEDILQDFLLDLCDKFIIDELNFERKICSRAFNRQFERYLAFRKRDRSTPVIPLAPEEMITLIENSQPNEHERTKYKEKEGQRFLLEGVRLLRQEFQSNGRGDVFEELLGYLKLNVEKGQISRPQQSLLSEGAKRVALHRLRKRLLKLVVNRIKKTNGSLEGFSSADFLHR